MSVPFNILITFIIVTFAHRNEGGCDVNDWPHSCLANFRIGKQACESCTSGRYGCNCSESCPDNTYGPGCYTFCNCPEGEFCDPIVGCKNITHTTHTNLETTDIYGVKSSSPPSQAENHILNNLTVSLLVSVGTVVFFGVICAAILIRVSKQFYKRQFQKSLGHWQSYDLTVEDTNVYSEYNDTDSLDLLTTIRSPSNHECSLYDHSSEASYNILSLRNMSISGNGYGGDLSHPITPPSRYKFKFVQQTNGHETKESDFDLEPECFLNLFDEDQSNKSKEYKTHREAVQTIGKSEQQDTTKL